MDKRIKVVNELKKLLDSYESFFIEKIKPSRKDDEIFICGYFLTSLEYVEGIYLLINKENFISVELLFRSLLETIVDISNLCNHKNYYLYLRREELKQVKKRYEKWNKDRENEFFPSIEKINDEFRKSIIEVKKEIEEIDRFEFPFLKNNSRRLEIKEKFKMPKIENVHSSIWDLVSSAIHNDLPNIKKRHIIREENGGIEITRKGKLKIEDISAHIITVPGLLFSALGEIFKKFGIKTKEIEDVYRKRNENLRNLFNLEEDNSEI